MLTQLQEEKSAFTSTVYFSWDSRKRQFGKTARSSFTCTPTFIRGVQIMHEVCGTDRPVDSIKDRSCKFGSWWPEMGKPVPVLTGFPFSCQHWPWSTPKTSVWLPLYQTSQMWCDHRTASARSAQGHEFLLLSEHTGWKLSWKIKTTMWTCNFTL